MLTSDKSHKSLTHSAMKKIWWWLCCMWEKILKNPIRRCDEMGEFLAFDPMMM